jgi:hypothetical protein
LIPGIEHAVFGLEHSIADDCTRVRDGGPIRRYRRYRRRSAT